MKFNGKKNLRMQEIVFCNASEGIVLSRNTDGAHNNNNNNNNYNNKLDIIICDNKPGTCMLIDAAILGDRNVIKKEAEKILRPRDRNSVHVECDSKSNTGYWNHFKITHTLPEQHTRKARN